jgi:cytochrome c biogenesis protein CcmG/thiol:disulfide interchange protein DsbE
MTQNRDKSTAANTSKKKLWLIVLILGLVVVLVQVGLLLFRDEGTMLSIGGTPKDFTLTTYSGEVVQTLDLEGKIVLINFWASWCTTCDEEAILLEQAWQEVRRTMPDDVVFLGVAYMDTEPAARDFLETYGITYPNGPDLRGEISKNYQVKGVPETYFLDRQGRLQHIKYGPFLSVDEIFAALEPLLEGSYSD